MPGFKCLTGKVVSSALCVFVLALFLTAPAVADDEPRVLEQAVTLFDDGEYLAAQELLAGLERSQLTAEQQALRDDYLSRCQVAITMYEKALRDLEDAETAIAEREYDHAESLLQRVLNNEYAARPLRNAASAHLRDLHERGDTGEESAKTPSRAEVVQAGMQEDSPPAESVDARDEEALDTSEPVAAGDVQRAAALTVEADELVRAGKYDEAESLYREALGAVPGYPEAVDGINRVRQHRENVLGTRGQSLIERIRREDAINWQRTVAQYRDAERLIRDHASADRFEEANQLLVRAQQVVDSGKQFADPVTLYENLRNELEALTTQLREDERLYHERKVAETRREIEQQRSARLREIEENRARQVEMLMQQALQHRKDGELGAAINVLKQVIVIDPKHSPARWLMDILEDQRHYRGARETRDAIYEQTRGALEMVEEAKIPWHEELKYSDDWLELITRQERSGPGRSRQDELIIGALDRPIPVDFQREPFQQVIERLASANRLNIIVNWHDLKRAGVEPDANIDLSLPQEITLKKAITEVLDQASGGLVDLGYDVSDGVISIATQKLLDHKTYPVVYDVTDLLMEITTFNDPPMTDLRDALPPERRVSQDADMPWLKGDDDDDEPEEDPERMTRVRKIIDLLQSTVAPNSWVDRGGSIGSIKEINGQLVVTQNSSGHEQISGLLAQLREERAIQISVEAIFLTVSSHYLEELGMDLDIVLNAGNAGYDFINSGQGPLTDPVLGNRLLLPRSFSQLGYTQAVPAGGNALAPGAAIPQPFNNPTLIPQQAGGGGSEGTPVPIRNSVLDFTNAQRLPSDVPGSFAGQEIGPALSIFGSFLDNIQVDFLIRATQADSRTSVLTAPRLVVFNGGSAWVAVTIQQNFVTQLQPIVAQQAVAQAPQVGTVDAGASLFVRATVTADRRYVMMLIAPGVTRLLALQTFQFAGGVGAFPAFIQLPTLSAQRLQTVVSVPDGGTLLVGGQKLANEAEIEAGVPILSKIPILKRAYSSRSMIKDEQTLLILIKPKVLIQSEQEEIAFPSFKKG
ncbi:MAG: hypothetical protein JSU63_05550 [Phycisphaerales bacterium]|nr:MAG: hypothetical protein JSU63_05550 [Phycisphaerales bacterium]